MQEVENQTSREQSEPTSYVWQEKVMEYHKDVRMTDRAREMWKDTTRRMEATK